MNKLYRNLKIWCYQVVFLHHFGLWTFFFNTFLSISDVFFAGFLLISNIIRYFARNLSEKNQKSEWYSTHNSSVLSSDFLEVSGLYYKMQRINLNTSEFRWNAWTYIFLSCIRCMFSVVWLINCRVSFTEPQLHQCDLMIWKFFSLFKIWTEFTDTKQNYGGQ